MATIKQIKDSDGNVHDILSTIGYGTCDTAAATAAKVATITDTSWTLKVGSIIGIKFTNTNTAGSSTTPVTLNVNSTGAKNIWYSTSKYTSTSGTVCGTKNRVIYYMYDGTYWVWMNSGALDGNSNTVPCIQIETAAATAEKVGTCTNYSLLEKSYAHANVRYSNTAQSALTLNVNSKGAKPIYINGTASSASNYTLPAGTYIIYYDGTNYHFRTDGVLPNLPTPPTIGNGKITITQAGTEKGSFTLNQSGNATIELTDNNTTYSTVTSSATGLCPKLPNDTTKYLRGDGTWVTPPDNNSHYTSKNIVGSSSTATANAAVTSNGVYLNHLEESTVKSSHKISGSGTVSVTSDSNGNIIITGSDHQSPGDGKITIAQAGIEKGSFTLNQSGNATIELTDTYDPLLVEVTYDELKELRDGSGLTPGQQYRITDYITTTTQENTESAGHQFDIIVTALNDYTLSEEAHAIQNGFDGYFDGENHIDGYFSSCDLAAWKIWYCLDNDTNRFGWADEENGKGVIYRMIDEWGNDCPYDFKNIKFKREICYGGGITSIEGDGDYEAYCYTFSWEESQGEIMDASIVGNNGDFTCVYKNTIGYLRNCKDYIVANGDDDVQMLNDIVFFGTYGLEGADGEFYGFRFNTFGNDCYTNTFRDDCHKNTFGHNCSNNTFGNYCYSNTFGDYCYENTFGDGCYENTFGIVCQCNTFDHSCNTNNFGNYCQSNTIGYYCYLNTFGDYCSENTLGEECSQNTFGNYCSENEFEPYCGYNIFGDECGQNKLEDDCQSNTFGNYCHYNTFGSSCYYNTFGNGCYDNTFGNSCEYNTFGNGCYQNKFTLSENGNGIKNNVSNNHFADLCSNINLYYPDNNGVIKNYNINKGVSGKNILVEFENSELCVDVWVSSSGEVIQEYINERIRNTKYSELKVLRDSSKLTPGQQYRITDYVTTTAAVDTQSAGHQFDIVVTALDNSTLCEEAHAIHNRGDEYFDSCNLEAWKIWYCLDNDTNRFGWAKEYIQEYIPGLGSLYKFHNWVTAVAKVCDEQIDTFYGGEINEKFSHFNYTENLDGIIVPTLYGRDLEGDTDNGLNIYTKYYYKGVYNVDGVDYDGWMQCYKAEDDEEYSYANDGNGNNIYILTERIVYNGKIEYGNGKGVIYRMIDEWGNDCPYDFKNIMFKKWLYEDDGGITTEDNTDLYDYCYTFSWQDQDYGIMDASVVGNNGYVTAEYGENKGVYGNVIGVWITGENGYPCQQLNSIVFLSTYMSDYGNYNGCYSNTFGENCYSNTFGDNCYSNTFGNYCYNNTFGDSCSSNTFSNNCSSNTFGNECTDNTFGNYCTDNKFSNNCYSNTFGIYCTDNKFSNNCYYNTFGNECTDNTFSNNCSSNTFDNGCTVNTFGKECTDNKFSNNCYSNTFGGICTYNTFGNNCYSNTFGNYCYGNTFGNYCYGNTFGNYCKGNTFGNYCYSNTFGNHCDGNTFGNYCYRNTFGNSSSAPQSYYRYIIFDNGNRYIYLYSNVSKGSSSYYQNVRIGLGVNNYEAFKTITDSNVGQAYETWYRPTNSKTTNI